MSNFFIPRVPMTRPEPTLVRTRRRFIGAYLPVVNPYDEPGFPRSIRNDSPLSILEGYPPDGLLPVTIEMTDKGIWRVVRGTTIMESMTIGYIPLF